MQKKTKKEKFLLTCHSLFAPSTVAYLLSILVLNKGSSKYLGDSVIQRPHFLMISNKGSSLVTVTMVPIDSSGQDVFGTETDKTSPKYGDPR